MLDALRRGAQGWLAKLLFALLIISFGVFWNVSGVFNGFGRGAVAHVGKEPITAEQFQRAFQMQMRSVELDNGRKLTSEQALMLGFDKQALEQLVAQAAVKEHTQKLGLALSDDALAEGIRKDPYFQGVGGKFSRDTLDQVMRQMNLSERGFLAVRRDDELRRQLSDAILGSIVTPQPLLSDLTSYREETRTFEQVQIDPKKVTVAEPDEAKLKETYEANKTRFMTPEYRKISALFMSAEDLKKEVKLTDDEIKAYFEETRANYDKPELRRLQQLSFKDKAAAEDARKALVEGKKNFMDVAKDIGASESDVSLGLIPKSRLIDPKIADAAFALERDKLSEVIEGRFTFALVRAVEIQTGETATFEGVKDRVRDALLQKRAEGMLQEKIDLVEEARNAGKTLAEIGKEMGLRYSETAGVDKDNKTADGKTAFEQPDAAAMLKEAFRAVPGETHDIVELAAASYAWYAVDSVSETKQKPFEDVKADAKAVFIEIETGRQLDQLAQTFVDRLKAGETMEKIAADAGGKVETTDSVKRMMSPPGLTVEAVKQAFTLPLKGAGYASTADKGTRVVFQIKEITPAPEPSPEQATKLGNEIKEQLSSDFILSYVAELRKDLGVTVNDKEIRRLTGVVDGETQ